MNQDMENNNSGNNKTVAIAIASILLLSIVIAGLIVWQKTGIKKSETSSQTSSNNTQKSEENVSAGGNDAQNSQSQEAESAEKISTLSFTGAEKMESNEKFKVNAMIDPKGKSITAAEIHIKFNPKSVTLENIEASEAFSQELMEAKIDNDNGTASIILGVPLDKPGVKEISTIASFNFKSLTSGENTEISFTNNTRAAAEGQKTDVLASIFPITVSM
jgi:hypothetical protein